MSLAWRKLPQGWMLFDEARRKCVLGVGYHWYRPWLYPLFTPCSHQVLQEYAFDHPFHNGCFVGLHPVVHEGRHHNFWATPPQRQEHDPFLADLGRVVLQPSTIFKAEAHSAFARLNLNWQGADGILLLTETREYRVIAGAEFNQVSMTCRLTAQQNIQLPATKFAGIGIRVAPELTPGFNARFGRIMSLDAGSAPFTRRGGEKSFLPSPLEEMHGESAHGIWTEAAHDGRGFGLYVCAQEPQVPWFARGYGLFLHNPLQRHGRDLIAGEELTWCLTLGAYDRGPIPREVM